MAYRHFRCNMRKLGKKEKKKTLFIIKGLYFSSVLIHFHMCYITLKLGLNLVFTFEQSLWLGC
jgi:hypothetical protein